jgi:hypothetical protein
LRKTALAKSILQILKFDPFSMLLAFCALFAYDSLQLNIIFNIEKLKLRGENLKTNIQFHTSGFQLGVICK